MGKKLVCGVGVNDIGNDSKGIRTLWNGMISRCYSERSIIDRPTYAECTVCDEWLVLSSFKKWCDDHYVDGYQLDKDIIKQGNKEYSPENCVFVPARINTLLNSHSNKRGDYQQGVCFHKASGRFRAQIMVNGYRKHLGLFDSEDDASSAYRIAKYKYIKDIGKECLDSGEISYSVYDALLKYRVK